MKNILFALFMFMLVSVSSVAQISITPAGPISVCGGSVTLSTDAYSPTFLPTLADDYYSNVISIGFPFTFYGSTYNQLVISSNGYLSFDIGKALSISEYRIHDWLPPLGFRKIPHNDAATQSVCGIYTDIYLHDGGSINYGTAGTTPNRKFVVEYCHCRMYKSSNCGSQWATFQIILYEATGNIETHIYHRESCTSWNNGYGMVGIEDAYGTGEWAPGRRVPEIWDVNEPVGTAWEGHRFTASGGGYSYSSIPYAPIPSNDNIQWFVGPSFVGSGSSITVTPTSSTTYTAKAYSYEGYLAATANKLVNVVSPLAGGSITGDLVICEGETTHLSFTGSSGGIWSCSPTTVGSVDPSTGVVTGTGHGTLTVTYYLSNPPCPPINETVNVLVNPLPDMPVIVETTGHHCVGDELVFKVTGQPGMEIHYGILPFSGSTVPLASVATLTGVGVFTISVTAVGPNTIFSLIKTVDPVTGCLRPGFDFPVIVDPYAWVGTILGGPNPLCVNDVATLTVAYGGVGSGFTTPPPFWSFTSTSPLLPLPPAAVSFSSSAGSPVTVTGVSPGTGIISFTVANMCNTVTATTPFTIKELPSVTATYIGCTPPCPSTPMVYYFSGTPGTLVTYQWTNPSGVTGTGSCTLDPTTGDATVTMPPAGSVGPFIVDITSILGANGCSMPPFSLGGMMVDWPKADFYQSPPRSICAGDCVTLWVTGTMGGCPSPGTAGLAGGTVYITDLSTGDVIPVTLYSSGPSVGIGSVTVCPTATTTYQITGAETYVCSHMFPGSTVTIMVIPLPVVTLTCNKPCEGTPLVFTAACPTCTVPYYWEGPGPGLPTTTPGVPTSTFTIPWAYPAYDGVYTVTGTTVGSVSGLLCASTATVTATVSPAPFASMSCTSTCDSAGGSVAILNFAGTLSSTVTFTTAPAGSGPTLTLTLGAISGLGTYTLSIAGTTTIMILDVESVDHCHSIVSFPGCTVTPVAPPTVTGGDGWVMTPAGGMCLAMYSSSVYPVDLGLSVQVGAFDIPTSSWTWGGGPLAATKTLTTGPTPIYGCDVPSTPWFSTAPYWPTSIPTPAYPCSTPSIFLHAGVVTATSVTYMGCTFPIYIPIDPNCASIPYPFRPGNTNNGAVSKQDESALSITPNPNTGIFTLSGKVAIMTGNETVTIEITDVLGKSIYTDDAQLTNGKLDKKVIIGDGVANGAYLIKVKNSKANEVLRFVLDR